MQVFRVYHHERKGYCAIPVTFSWAAFATSFLWAAANGLWGKAGILFIAFAGMGVMLVTAGQLNSQMMLLAVAAGLALVPLWAGMQANHWYCERLEKQGYKLVKKINAESAQSAIRSAQPKEARRK